MDGAPLVSILINNYNYAGFVSQAIESALNQTYDRVEVVVVDDGSKDNSREVIASYGEKIVSIFKQNGGQASAFNAGFAASQGDILCFLDADDLCDFSKVSRVVEEFQKHPDAGWLFHLLQKVDSQGNALADDSNETNFSQSLFDFREKISKGQPIRTVFPATSGLCFKRYVLQQTFPMPEQLKISADNFLRLSAIHVAPGLLLNEKLAMHRIHGSNAFESRKDIAYLHAETNIQTSYYLKKRFPETKAFTNQLFAHSFGRVAGRSGFNKASQIFESKKYLEDNFSIDSWFTCSPRILYNYAKSMGSRSPK
ncbi:glycosyltransferase family 2 protein [Myxacorys almedinensis]|uniref:Glycosyltransferase n=1 Tax=Myxacorys almedinensis A TaxID=2690445 RepID=A0A8J7Z0K2_9CYAN|nr:glycosyltransferase [Myxacorys almedinensis]NDJ18042.1 glycosyltransferase [Myxacorys almedinensis A]